MESKQFAGPWRLNFPRQPQKVISSFFLCLSFSSSLLLLQYPIQNLCIPKIAAHCEKYSNHLPLRQGSTSQHLSLSSKVMATETSFHFSFLLFSTGFDCFLCFYFYFSQISLLFQTCDRPAAGKYTQFVTTRIEKVNKRKVSHWNAQNHSSASVIATRRETYHFEVKIATPEALDSYWSSKYV